MALESIEMFSPVSAVAAQPFVEFGESARFEGVDSLLGTSSCPHQTHVSQHSQVSRDRRLGQERQTHARTSAPTGAEE